MVKNLPAMQETTVQSLGWKDPLGKEMVTHSSILAWRIPCKELMLLNCGVGEDSSESLALQGDQTSPS